MCILSRPLPNGVTSLQPTPTRLLPPTTRQQLVLDALAGQSIRQLAQQHHVSRKVISALPHLSFRAGRNDDSHGLGFAVS